MRLRHIPEADEFVSQSSITVSNPESLKGRWSSAFQKAQPTFLEIGMGKGQFIIKMALAHPDCNYIGIERYSSVLMRAIQHLLSMGDDAPDNLLFISGDASDLPLFFESGEISGIYLNFSDPWPKKRHAKRRLTSKRFRDIYYTLLLPGSAIEFKTDNSSLFDFSLDEFKNDPRYEISEITYDLHNDSRLSAGNITTEYEDKFSSSGNPIKKLIAIRK